MMIEDMWMTVEQELDFGRYQYFGKAKTHQDDDEPYILKDSTHSQSCKRSGGIVPSSFGLINEVVPLKNYDERQCSNSWLHRKIIPERKNNDEDWKNLGHYDLGNKSVEPEQEEESFSNKLDYGSHDENPNFIFNKYAPLLHILY